MSDFKINKPPVRAGGKAQKLIIINKTPINMTKGGDSFLSVRRDIYRRALIDLTSNTFKVWTILVDNKNGYWEYLSTQAIADDCNISKKTVQNCIAELIEKGYLVLKDKEDNSYNFYDSPRL